MPLLSAEFALFVAIGFLVFHGSPKDRRAHVLLALSYLFYLTWSTADALLLLGLTVCVYLAARSIDRPRPERSKLRITVGMLAGLLLLLVGFKCGAGIVQAVRGANTPAALIAPLGLSYYLFKLMGYLLDVYWEKRSAEQRFIPFALYVAFFPQMTSGPIQRAGDFFDQLPDLGQSNPSLAIVGLRRILFGAFKKLVLADNIAVIAGSAHANPSLFSSLELLMGAYCYALQLYIEFSGFTDIALGVGLLFGIRGPENFALPYFARSLPEFWRRWHISLTSWISDYVFAPLLMSLRDFGVVGLATALFVNMMAVAFWHGPQPTFAVFGALNGVFMVVSVLTQKRRNAFFRNRPALARLRVYAGPVIVFHTMAFTMIFFRAASLSHAIEFLRCLVPGFLAARPPLGRLDWSLLGIDHGMALGCLAGIAVVEAIHWAQNDGNARDRFVGAPRFVRWGLYYAAILLIAVFGNFQNPQFIYAQF